MVTVLAVLAMLLAAPVLQATLLYHAAPGGVTVDLIFLLSVTVGLFGGVFAGFACGGGGGLVLGTALGSAVLPMAAVYGLVGVCAALAGRRWPLAAAAPAAASLTFLLLFLETFVLAPLGGIRPSLRPAAALAAWHAGLVLPLAALFSRTAIAPIRP